jgi:hypothetical protein
MIPSERLHHMCAAVILENILKLGAKLSRI